MDRRTARKEAFCLIFEYSFNGDKPVEEMIEGAKQMRDLGGDEYISHTVLGVAEHCAEIDESIEAHLKGWTKNRLSRVALAILRLAIYEIKFIDEIPDSVSVNEAVELAKTYDDEQGAAFINGLLGSYIRSQAEEG